jgi:hypothetical protein
VFVCNELASFGHTEFRMFSVIIERHFLREVDDVCSIITSLMSLEVIFKIIALTFIDMKRGCRSHMVGTAALYFLVQILPK